MSFPRDANTINTSSMAASQIFYFLNIDKLNG